MKPRHGAFALAAAFGALFYGLLRRPILTWGRPARRRRDLDQLDDAKAWVAG